MVVRKPLRSGLVWFAAKADRYTPFHPESLFKCHLLREAFPDRAQMATPPAASPLYFSSQHLSLPNNVFSIPLLVCFLVFPTKLEAP